MDADDRRDAILAAAAEAFGAHPYSEVKIAAIAAAAGASDALVYRYFAGKEDLYLAVVAHAVADLTARQQAALAQLPELAPAQDRIQAILGAYLDHIAADPEAWAMPRRQPGTEPAAAAELRRDAQRALVEQLRAALSPGHTARHEYALWGFFGFVDDACLRWVDGGAAESERWPLIDAALGALRGALGDWAA